MPKQYYTIRDWSGGMNSRKDPRDLKENEYSYIQNMSIDALGKIKTAGKLYAHIEDQDGDTNLSEYIVERTANLVGSGGYGLFYFESDHGRDNTQTITTTDGSTALALGTSPGQISFNKTVSNPDDPFGVTVMEDSPR
jgi:hypothetical protein|tara:strand:+ start:361 stop:774 length:414 start_codon:yes stop_codon:yes gene_type:complete